MILCRTDGENKGLMDLLHGWGMDVGEAVCPYPMTEVKIAEYHQRWADKVTIFGGVPSNVLLPRMCSKSDFDDFMKGLFADMAPGRVSSWGGRTPPRATRTLSAWCASAGWWKRWGSGPSKRAGCVPRPKRPCKRRLSW